MSTPKIPSHSCPSYVCARIRKILAAKGWPMHKTTGRYAPFVGNTKESTEGFDVTKVGCSKSVSVSYRQAYRGGQSLPPLEKGFARARVAEAIEYLRSLGYRVDDRGWIECDSYDEHDR